MQSEQTQTPTDESNYDPDLIEIAPPLIPEANLAGSSTRNETGDTVSNTTPTSGNATGNTGNTDSSQTHQEADLIGSESLPVTPKNDVIQESQSPVIQPAGNAADYFGLHGNQAGIQPAKITGNTEEKGSKSYRLPLSVIQSIEDAVQELKKVLPELTAHQYGIDILTKHRELRQAVSDVNFYRAKLGEQQKTIQELMDELLAERRRTADLTAQLSETMSYLHRIEHTPVGNPVIPPVIPQPKEVIQAVLPGQDQEYRNLLGRYESAINSRKDLEAHIRECHQFLNVQVVGAVNALVVEAARNSWFRPDYYHHVFHANLTQKIG